jgi:hypothetical protein
MSVSLTATDSLYAYNGSLASLLGIDVLFSVQPGVSGEFTDDNGVLTSGEVSTVSIEGGADEAMTYIGTGTASGLVSSTNIMAFSVGAGASSQIYIYAPDGFPLLGGVVVSLNIDSSASFDMSPSTDAVDGTYGNDVMDVGYEDDDGDEITNEVTGTFLGLNDQSGNDEIYGYAGDDQINGGSGDDTIDGGTGNDTIYGGDGEDILTGGDGDDTIYGGDQSGNDVHKDTIYGGTGNDTIYAGDGNNTVYGQDGDDTISAGANNDYIVGGEGNDTISSGGGSDTIYGGAGDDTLDGGAGYDNLSGGAGNDIFIVSSASDAFGDIISGGSGPDATTDVDEVDLSAFDKSDYTINALEDPADSGALRGTVQFTSGETFSFSGIEVICFARGTEIFTSEGPVAVEDLAVGNRILTMDRGMQPLRWIGRKKLGENELAAAPKLKPIRIAAGALGNGTPLNDLLVSRQHRILVRSAIADRMFGVQEILVAAIKLVGHPGVEVVEDAKSVEYFHMLFDQHEIVFSNGAATESLFTGPEALKAISEDARAEILELFPDIATQTALLPARHIPQKGRMVKRFVERHAKNNKSLMS